MAISIKLLSHLPFIISLLCLNCLKKEIKLAQAPQDSLQVADSVMASSTKDAPYVHGEIKPNQGLFQALGDLGASVEHSLAIVNVLRFKVELTSLKAGEKVSLRFSPDSSKILEFIYEPNPVMDHVLRLDTATGKYIYYPEKLKTDINYRFVDGILEEGSSLHNALLAHKVHKVLTGVVSGILMGKINFRTDAKAGDRFNALLKEETYKGQWINGSVLYTSYKGRRTGFHEAYKYQDEDPKSSYNAHYTPRGEALVHTGLRFPVDRLHISSGYGMRYHPLTGRRSMHFGVDYSGRVGTPVYAVASGTVVFSTYDIASGNKIAIRHADRSTSYYLHLSKRLVKKGQKVRSHQIIGKIGSTGFVTGPHLHFGFKDSEGRWINPLRKRMIATNRLKGQRLEQLKVQMSRINKIIMSTMKKRIPESHPSTS